MPLFRRGVEVEPRSLDDLIVEAKAFVERNRPNLEPDDDFIPTVLTDGRKGPELHALALPGGALEKALQKIARKSERKSERFVFWAAAWQAEGVDSPDVRASEHPGRFEAVVIQAAEPGSGREELWRAKLDRVPDEPPRLGDWERMG